MEVIKKISSFDLNLLCVFAAIDQYRHVTQAAKFLGMTQPALSHALNRLRILLDDQLFVKSSNGMVPTPKAETLSVPIKNLLSNFNQDILGSNASFDPKTMSQTFRIFSTDFVESLILPKLLKILEIQAPHVKIVTKSTAFSFPRDDLELGSCDIAIAGFFGDLPDGFYQQKLFSDSFACAVAKRHPRLGSQKNISMLEYSKERHVLIAPGADLSNRMDALMRKKNLDRTIVAGLSNFMVSGWVIAQSDSILTAPSRLINQLADFFPIQTFKLPLDISEISIAQVWHERSHQDPGHKWMREQIKKVLQS